MNLYERLRSFPQASQPKDLDQRINAARQKIAAQGGGAGGATTQPIEPR
jgi:hypothetical protein